MLPQQETIRVIKVLLSHLDERHDRRCWRSAEKPGVGLYVPGNCRTGMADILSELPARSRTVQ